MATATLYPTECTYISKEQPTANNNGNDFLRLGYGSATTKEFRIVLRFDYRDIPKGSTISSAKLQLYSYSNECWQTAIPVWARFITKTVTWNAASVTWNTTPYYDTTSVAQTTATVNGYETWHDFEIKQILSHQINTNQNYGIMLGQNSSATSLAKCYRKTGTYRPKLVITYTPPAANGAPQNATLTPQYTESTADLAWDGATAGTGNSISGYQIDYYDISLSDSVWGNKVAYQTIASTQSSGTLAGVPAPEAGYRRAYHITTLSSLGNAYASLAKRVTPDLYLASAPTAPTSLTLSTPATASTAILSWSGAQGGLNNAISGYKIEYRDIAPDGTEGEWTVLEENNVEESIAVSPPQIGYRRQFRVQTLGEHGIHSGYQTGDTFLRRGSTAQTRQQGEWKTAQIWCKQDGNWKPVLAWKKEAGNWKQLQ